jgi:hypothetical protein
MELVDQNSLAMHLHERCFSMNLHRAWLGEDVATFPLWNLSGQLVGYQHYRPNASKEAKNDPREGRYFTRLARDRVGVWGLESWSFSDVLFLCEGVFDACKVTWLGYSALAVFSTEVNPTTASWLRMLRSRRRVVALCDGDGVGLRLAKYAHDHVQIHPWHDVGDAPLEYVNDLCQRFNED